MRSLKLMAKRFEREDPVIEAILNYLPVGERTQAGRNFMATLVEEDIHFIGSVANMLIDLGLMKSEIEYPGFSPEGKALGRVGYWTLLAPPERVRETIAKHRQKLREDFRQPKASKPEKIMPEPEAPAIKLRGDVPVAAIVGPNRPNPLEALRSLRKDEEGALIEAARQYHDRTSTIDAKIDEMAALARNVGAQFDADMIRSAFQFNRDERLESVGLVLPYIDRLERRVGDLANQIGDAVEQIRTLKASAREADELREQNKRLVSENASLKMARAS